MDFPHQLVNGLWHTTSFERFINIKEIGLILANPDIPDEERWCTAQGKAHYPFVRHIGGVSLFDFSNFDYCKYNEKHPQSSISSFVPRQKKWEEAIWLEINRAKVGNNFVDPVSLVNKWKSEEKYGHNIMPYVECAYIGDIPVNYVSRTLIYRNGRFKVMEA